MKQFTKHYLFFFCLICVQVQGQDLPKILSDKAVAKSHYVPDYSYAGYHFSEKFIPISPQEIVLSVTDFGAIANDGLDDTQAVFRCLEKAISLKESVEIRFPKGRFILSDIIYITRSNLVLSGAGSGPEGTTLYYPRPMKYFSDPEPLSELREYLIELDKRQHEPENNLDLPFSQFAWSGGMIWTLVPDERVKDYLDKYDVEPTVLAEVKSGKRGSHELTLKPGSKISVGDVVQIDWYNPEGEEGSLLSAIYDHANVKIGSHHWRYPSHSIVQQQVKITKISGDKAFIKDPLLHDAKAEWNVSIVEWKHLEEVGIQHFAIEFPMAPNIAHHVEEGYNAIYLTSLYNGWVTDVSIKNADSGILTEESANITISNIRTTGDKVAHYTVSMGSVHNVLVENLQVYNSAVHPLSFNTHATKSVYKDCIVYRDPILDQHSGANHQNLFDNIQVFAELDEATLSYPLFVGGGAGYWKPSHGAFTTFWNIDVQFQNGFDTYEDVILNGMTDGPSARLIGIHANRPIRVEYGPNAYIEAENIAFFQTPSLFDYQLAKRLKR